MRFDDVVELLDDVDRLEPRGEAADLPDRQRVHNAELQVIHRIAERLFRILVRRARDDHAGFRAVVLDEVEGARLGPFALRRRALFDDLVLRARKRRQHDILRLIFLIRPERHVLALHRIDDAARVRDARRKAQDDRRVKLLGKRVGELCHVAALRGVRRLQHQKLRRDRVVARILLVLRGMHARVVGHADHHARVHADVAHRENRVSRHVQADVLHAAEAARAADRRARRDLRRNLFVRRPFAVDLVKQCGRFRNFRAGRARIARDDAHAGLVQAARYGLVAL